MDGLAGAFAHFDFIGDRLVVYGSTRVAPKMTQNGQVFPYGYETVDDSWVNLLSDNASFGWHGPQSGNGVHELGELLANSDAFVTCLVGRTFAQVCGRPLGEGNTSVATSLAKGFVEEGYQLRKLFEATASSPSCLGI